MVESWHYEYYVFDFIFPVAAMGVAAEWRESESFTKVARLLGRKGFSAIFFVGGIAVLVIGVVGYGRIYPVAPWGIKETASLFRFFCAVTGLLSILSGCVLILQGGKIRPAILMFIVLTPVLYGDGMVEQLFGYEINKDWQVRNEKEYKAPFQWMNSSLSAGNVILASPFPSDVSTFIPVYTQQKVFLNSESTVHPTPGHGGFQKRLLIIFALMDMTEDNFTDQVIKGNKLYHRLYFRGTSYRAESLKEMLFDSARRPPLTHEELLDALREYNYYRYCSVEKLFHLERIDYLYWGPTEKRYFKAVRPEQIKFLEEVFSEDDVQIYRVKR
jgi:hypothetical protein